MMDIWWRVAGYVRVRLTGADLARNLRELAQLRLRMEKIEFRSDLTAEFTLSRRQFGRLADYAEKSGLKWERVSSGGIPELGKRWLQKPLLLVVLALLLGASLFLPSRILFFRVEGNHTVPTRLILEKAEQCGVDFGASRRSLRSEQVKNQLLSAIPELSWVGVNTRGCVSTISVQERQLPPEERESLPGNIVAIRDAVVESLTVTGGTELCAVGQAVQAGQILVSGYTDLGICTRMEEAQAEIYGRTSRQAAVVLSENTTLRGEPTGSEEKYSVIFGKKRINFYSDSGILQGSCGKMTQVKQLTLPGGWELPVYLVVQTLTRYDQTAQPRENAEALLLDAAKRQTRQVMVAGSILEETTRITAADGAYRLLCEFQCREMIGKQSHGVYIEGDTEDDGTNRERGTG